MSWSQIARRRAVTISTCLWTVTNLPLGRKTRARWAADRFTRPPIPQERKRSSLVTPRVAALPGTHNAAGFAPEHDPPRSPNGVAVKSERVRALRCRKTCADRVISAPTKLAGASDAHSVTRSRTLAGQRGKARKGGLTARTICQDSNSATPSARSDPSHPNREGNCAVRDALSSSSVLIQRRNGTSPDCDGGQNTWSSAHLRAVRDSSSPCAG